MPASSWYSDGLRFRCSGCGDCCTGAPGYVWVNQQEIDAMADFLKMSSSDFEAKYVRRIGIRRSLKEDPANYDCVFFDNQARTCQLYEHRPRQCRTWPFWKSNLKTAESWEQTAEGCPGCNQGKLHSVELIDEQASVIDV